MEWTQALLAAFAVGLLILASRTLRPRLRLLVDERGILDRRLRLGWIHWDEIEGAYPPSARDGEALRVRLRLRRRRSRGLSVPDSGFSDVRLDLAGSPITAAELLQEILRHTARGGWPDPGPEPRDP